MGRLSCTCTFFPTMRTKAHSCSWHLDPSDLNLFPSTIMQCLKRADLFSYSSGVQKSRFQSSRSPGLEAAEENLFPCPSHLPEATCIPWLVAPCSIFKVHHSSLCFGHHMVFSSDSHCLPHPSYKDLSDCIEPA